jgi:hypothetical protein
VRLERRFVVIELVKETSLLVSREAHVEPSTTGLLQAQAGIAKNADSKLVAPAWLDLEENRYGEHA